MSTAVVEGFEVVDLEDLDAAGVLDALSDSDLQERRATAWKLALAYQWAVLHPAPVESNILESPETLGGDGTPEVAAFTAEPLAVRLRITRLRPPRWSATPWTWCTGTRACGARSRRCGCRPGRPARWPSRPAGCR